MTPAKFLQTMKRWFYITTLLLFISTLPSCAQNERPAQGQLTWYTSLAEAQKVSNSAKKPIFAFFTGSDWCGWCQKLHHDVLEKQSFIDWAKKNVVLLELDYPRRKQLSPELQQQNGELQQVFKVQGYPTVWIFNLTDDPATKKKNISAFGSLGYPQGAEAGKEEVKFLKDANAVLANKPQ
jgi:protein disulfide-isomerase